MKFNELRNRNDLASILKIPKNQFSYLLYKLNVNKQYEKFEIPKKSGGTRTIHSPNDRLKYIQKRLNEEILNFIDDSDYPKSKISHGYEKGKSISTNASVHVKKRYVLNIDIEDFFGSINFGRVRGFFNKNKFFSLPLEVSTIIAQICCKDGVLPQGAPTSPIISNLIGHTLDYRISILAKKYKMNYSRYVDDLTFSTNEKNFELYLENFLSEFDAHLNNAGFKRNKKKTRLQYKRSRQSVTGVIVNEDLSIPNDFYKNTRAMLNEFIKNEKFFIDEKDNYGTLNQLEGRLSYINHFEKMKNMRNAKNKEVNKKNHTKFSTKEKEFKKFLFYKNFIINDKPLIITEGKTDVLYLKAALKNLHSEYPNLIEKKDNGNYDFKVKFFQRSKRNRYFFIISKDGADAMKNLVDLFIDKRSNNVNECVMTKIKTMRKTKALNPVILLFDNEMVTDRPLKNFLNFIKISPEDRLKFGLSLNTCISDNLFLLTNDIPLKKKDVGEAEIEDLLPENILNHVINGKMMNYTNGKDKQSISKDFLSKYVVSNYEKINFDKFRPLLNSLNSIIENY
ncbi:MULTISPECIES: retron Ec67 family RNA-directed DNA polymerase/endonuclease [Exiguobacterium]|uniref:retron Ec67 family RNA-directed DNA polymerase/endonuclease n=1 Tax=Exiguobacterium TaxID=33986 RepID=UPI001BEAF3C1|nr:retron Ec67 family RNA-directed DNA polymerase/endonuclease [Exiguobacterium sp. s144]